MKTIHKSLNNDTVCLYFASVPSRHNWSEIDLNKRASLACAARLADTKFLQSIRYRYIQSTPLNRATSVRGHFDPIKRRTLLTENIFY